MSDFVKEFQKFIARGNVIDLAVGVIIGGAFGQIVTSLVNDIVMPPIGLLLGGVDFSNLFINLSDEDYATLADAQAAGAATINYGQFINVVLNFLIVAFVVFLMVRWINRMKEIGDRKAKEDEAAAPTTRECPYCISTIPLAATRCPQCTSELPIAEAA